MLAEMQSVPSLAMDCTFETAKCRKQLVHCGAFGFALCERSKHVPAVKNRWPWATRDL